MSSIARLPVRLMLRNLCNLTNGHKLAQRINVNLQVSSGCCTMCSRQRPINLLHANELEQVHAIKHEALATPHHIIQPDLPKMEFITKLDLSSTTQEPFTKVQHNQYEFIESNDGFVQVHVKSACNTKTSAAKRDGSISFGVYFGADHPLNHANIVTGYQGLEHGVLLGAMRAIEIISKNSIKKLCINTSDKGIIDKAKRLDQLKNTGYLKKDGRPYLMRDTFMQLDQLLRQHNDMIIRWKYVFDNNCTYELRMAEDLAKLKLKSQ